MVQPKPIELTQVDAEDYDGSQEPQPFVVVGPIPGTVGSGVQSIVPGTNVTVDDSDPQNPIVSATGGGGGGAVDSVNGQTGVVVLAIPETPEDIGAATASQGAKADTAVQPAALSSYVPTSRTVAGKALSSNVTLVKADVGLGSVDNTSDASKPLSTAATNALAGKADLVGGLVPTSQLPPLAINETFTAASQAAMLALTAQRGDMAIRTDTGRTFVLSSDSPSTLADWKEVMAAGQVASVAGKTGVVSLVKADVGLGSVDNTADSAKPVSTAQQAALDLKAPLASPTFTGTVSGVTKAHVGLGSVDNTSDVNKPVSTAQAAAINAKVGSPNSTVTGVALYANLAALPATGTAGVIYYVDAV